MTTTEQLILWSEEASKEATAQAANWYEASTGETLSEREVSAYRAGFLVGWRDCIATASLHNLLK